MKTRLLMLLCLISLFAAACGDNGSSSTQKPTVSDNSKNTGSSFSGVEGPISKSAETAFAALYAGDDDTFLKSFCSEMQNSIKPVADMLKQQSAAVVASGAKIKVSCSQEGDTRVKCDITSEANGTEASVFSLTANIKDGKLCGTPSLTN